MKIKRINTAFLLLALAGLTLTGCCNEDIANVTPQEEGTGNVSFSIVEKDYEPADNTPKSRAAAEEMKPEVQDLGNGLIAEVSLVPDTTHRAEAPKTRAINTPTHYTIQAFQGGVKKGELKGKFNGSTFTPDLGQPEAIALPHGTYDFVCFNDGVTSNGTQLTVNRADAETARFDVRRNVQINQDPKQQVKFTMKHAGASIMVVADYINFFIQGRVTNTQYMDKWSGQMYYRVEPANPAEKYTLLAKSPVASVPETMVYDLSTNTYSYPTMGQFSKPSTVDIGGVPVAWSTPGNVGGYTGSTLLEDYWLPTTDCSKLKLTITSGEISGVSLVGKTITVSEHKLVEANKQYIVHVRLYFTDIYIYHDGSTGPLSQNPGKIPVAVLVYLPDNGGSVGIALHDAKVGGNDQIQWNTTNAQQATSPYTNYSDLLGVKNDFNTTVPSYPSSTAIQAAQNYSSVVPSITSWEVPAFKDFVNVGVKVGKMLESDGAFKKFWGSQSFSYLTPSGAAVTGFTPAPSTINFPAMDMTRFNQAFTKVGGTPPSGTYWTSTECKDGSEYKQVTITISSDGKFHLGLKSKTETAKVRPMKLY